MKEEKKRKVDRPYFTLLFLIVDFFLFLYALTLIIVGIHIIIDHGIMLEITNGSIYLVGIYFLIFCGILMVFTVIIGFIGIIREQRFLLIIFIVLLILIFILSFIGSVLLLAFKSSINDSTKATMKENLQLHYFRVRLYTDAWDSMQSRLRCCAVEDRGWDVYQNSYWDNNTNVDMNNRETKIPSYNTFYKFVPNTCCWALIDPQTGWPSNIVRNEQQCQQWQFGPPNKKDGPQNDAIYYRGCANALKGFIGMYADGFGAFTFIYLLVIIIGIILAIIELLRSSRKYKEEKRRKEEYPQEPILQPGSSYNPQYANVDQNDNLDDNASSRRTETRSKTGSPSVEFSDPIRNNY